MKIIAIVQARMGSKRLPGKILMEIEGKPMLWHVVKRVSSSRLIDAVVVATSSHPDDDKVEVFCRKNNFNLFRGSQEDCLDRFYKAARKFKADIVVRITADCPLISPEIIDQVISKYLKGKSDYATNTILYTYPDGCDVEVFSFRALAQAWYKCKDSLQKEHVTLFIRNSGNFKIKNVENKNPVLPNEFKWSVDKLEDLEFVKFIYKHLYKNGKIFKYKAIMALLKQYPELKKINYKTIVNEGYYLSLLKLPLVKPRKKIKIKDSLRLKEKAKKLIPGCSQTFSKGPTQFVQGVAPVFLEKGKGAYVWDVDRNRYIDYAMALGPIILGHNYPKVSGAVRNALSKGTTFTLPHRLEVELSELLCRIIPCAQMVRLGKNGSDVTSAAIRLSRAYTDRDIIACCGYHGWQDWYIATTTMNKGIPEEVKKLTLTFEYNNIESLEKIFNKNKNKVACVIMEPTGVVEPCNDFLQKVEEITHKNGALLVFDEVVTGFRFALGGAQDYFKVIPDLACFGKAMGNGFPIAAIVGKKEIMRLFEEVFYSFTFGGEIVSTAAAIATIKELKDKNVIPYLWEQGRKIKDGYNVLTREFGFSESTECIGYAPRTVISFKNKKKEDNLIFKSLFQQECIKRGVLFTGNHNICYSHSNKDIDYTLRVYKTVLEIIKQGLKNNSLKRLLRGRPVESVFRKA